MSSTLYFDPHSKRLKMLKAFWKTPHPSNFYTMIIDKGVAWDEDKGEYCSCMSCKLALMKAAYVNAQNRTSEITAKSAYKNAFGLD